MTKPFVAVLMGSDSDYEVMESTISILKLLKIPFEAKVTSAHRTPEETLRYVVDADARGCAVFIAAAGLAAHLAGTVAAYTLKPVIGVPLAVSLHGMDALLSTVQMPAGVPVASMGIGVHGAKNAAYFAAQILALSDDDLATRVKQERAAKASDVLTKNSVLQTRLSE